MGFNTARLNSIREILYLYYNLIMLYYSRIRVLQKLAVMSFKVTSHKSRL